jgi:4-alpha-glucanotransferase
LTDIWHLDVLLHGLPKMRDSELRHLASQVGIQSEWRDVSGSEKIVSDDNLRAILKAMGFAAETASDVFESKRLLLEEEGLQLPLISADVGEPLEYPQFEGAFRIRLESGVVLDGKVSDHQDRPTVFEPGYHILEIGGREVQLAVAPRSCFTVAEAARRQKIWGIAVQLYSLRRARDGGIGDFTALAEFARSAASHGADAVAISPVHALFSSDPSRFGPYAPSNRAALNILHVAEASGFDASDGLVDWPAAGAAKLAAIRRAFTQFGDEGAFEMFCHDANVGVKRHAIYEAINVSLASSHGTASDWRKWPTALRDPDSDEVAAFTKSLTAEIRFQLYSQYRADIGLREAQAACRDAGMKIGLIADLAIGTDAGGSQSWSRQDEILQGLEVGAPPDAINREGQSWGITAFSPRGLRKTGFSAFIEMLRHAMRHAGGVRIDHVMGLARLWVIPHGRPSSEGAYLSMPVRDLMRLVRLESHRHQAVVIGEDLGTLPEGFHSMLDDGGMSGLRVLWFEKNGVQFKKPSAWSKTAVAVTSTHDLPTVAGWWRGQDISWREKLGMAGDGMETRDAERSQLWSAMVEAGAAAMPMPGPDDSDVVADAACAFLGQTEATLALLPIEDAIGLPEQPNLPGTTDEHPNWRRRLPEEASVILDRPDVAARLAKLHAARQP